MTARAAVVVAAALVSLVSGAGPALAHGDARLAEEQLHLDPGEAASFTAGLHYHRLAATVSADAPVTVELVHAATDTVVASAGPDTTIALNELVRCCPDAVWADHGLAVRNPGTTAATADVRARLVHDDLAVMVDGAEDGTRVSIVVLGLAWAALLWRAVRRRPLELPLRRAVGRLAGVSVAVLVLTAWGTWRYGVGGAPALVAGLADLPILPFNPIVSRASLLLAVAIVVWGRAGTAWARSSAYGSPAWWGTGAALLGSVGVAATAVAMAYGAAGAAIGAAAAAGLPLLAVPVWHRRPAPTAAGPPLPA